MTLSEKQQVFAQMASSLISQAHLMGYDVTLGEAYRPPETAALYAKDGKGITSSLHTQKLAIDLSLFKDGEFLTDVSEYEPLGEWWEAQGTAQFTTCWGGRFERVDADHFSISHNGIR